ncbi:MAG: competence/damage-inducible protein A [Ndongobacter sp.]|nr:competence/damage-inducible protein A [Ndongobacter sp.]
MIVELISVGTELLLGEIVNTNVQYLCKGCAELGLDVFHTSVVGDNVERLRNTLQQALTRSDLVILTGGLGSTNDDLTKQVVLEVAGQPTVTDAASVERIKAWFSSEQALRDNQKVAQFPERARIFENHHGTASGAWIPVGEKEIVILPGPPREMVMMCEESLWPLLRKRQAACTLSRTIYIGLLGEYDMNRLFTPWMLESTNPTFAPYAKEDGAQIRITAKAASQAEAEALLQKGVAEVQRVYKEWIVSSDGRSKAAEIIEILRSRKEHVAIAESLTGGMVASALVDIAGASDVLDRAWVTYSNQAKHRELGVSQELLTQYGAVHPEVAEEMAQGAALRANAELSIATTGFAGPDDDEAGLFYIGIWYRGKAYSYKNRAKGDRYMVRNRCKNMALDYALLILKKEEQESEMRFL